MQWIKNKNGLYPLLSVATSICILVVGLLLSDSVKGLYYLAGVWALFLLFGYYRACIAVIPFTAVTSGIFCIVTYAISQDADATLTALGRILSVCVAVVPGLGLESSKLVSSLSTLKAPRAMTLGMMIALSFFPLLAKETKIIREAMKTRGAGSMLNPKIFYRAFLLPLAVRLVNISDTLSLSVETRGFSVDDKKFSVYEKIKIKWTDVAFVAIFMTATVVSVVL